MRLPLDTYWEEPPVRISLAWLWKHLGNNRRAVTGDLRRLCLSVISFGQGLCLIFVCNKFCFGHGVTQRRWGNAAGYNFGAADIVGWLYKSCGTLSSVLVVITPFPNLHGGVVKLFSIMMLTLANKLHNFKNLIIPSKWKILRQFTSIAYSLQLSN